MQAGQQRLQSVLPAGLQPVSGCGDPLGLALCKAGGGEGGAGQKVSRRRGGCPATEQIHLFLHRQEGTDLFEEVLKFRRSHAGVTETFQSAPAGHQLFKQGQPLGSFSLGREIAAEQVKHPVRPQSIELVAELLANGWQLAHPLQ